MVKEAYIVDGVRTAIGNFGGTLSGVRADDLGAIVLKSIVAKFPSLDQSWIEEVFMGCANQAGEDNRNVARMSSLLAQLPLSIGAETINRLCASGMAATVNAARAIKDNAGDIFIAGGVEHMTRGPWVMSKASSAYGRDSQLFDSSFGWRFINPKMEQLYGVDSMGMTAENLASKFNISRDAQDSFALWSQQKATISQQKGIFAEEITPVIIPQKKKDALIFDQDEFIRPYTSFETLQQLKAAFSKDGSVTAGNASGLNDGAAALLISSEKGLINNNLEPKVKILAGAVAGVEPRIMGIGPVFATQKVLRRAGLTLDQMDVIEMNEAFAAQVLACTRSLGLADNDPRINPHGGAIALGHPLGMSGARIILSATNELIRSKKKYALATMCIGVGQGYAVILENTTI
jgi:3-oxoadipyl-CoA thiolase